MKKTVKDVVIANTASACKKCKPLTPLFMLIAGVILVLFYIGSYFKQNGKRYTTICLCLVFFFMSSSFSFPENNSDGEIYITNSSEQLSDISVIDISGEIEELTNTTSEAWIEDGELKDSDFEKSLSNTDDIETFTLDDFINLFDSEENNISNGESSFDKNAWNLILVNKTHPIPDDYDVPLATISGSMKCDERVKDVLTNMLSDASKQGVSLIVCSPYRDYKLQETLFNRKINLYMSKGYSYIDAYRITSQKVTVPGASEHQIGLAFDIVTAGHTTLDYEFGDTVAGKWLKENSKNYGFILRYPRGKEYITGIEFEPWHFRYVGVEAATYIMDNDITLEEFIDELE